MAISNKKETFAQSGGESFELNGKKKDKKSDPASVILNIQESAPSRLLYKKEEKVEPTGAFSRFFKKVNEWLIEHSKVKTQDKAVFFHMLAVTIKAGMPMVKALRSLSVQMEKNPKLKKIIIQIADKIEEGKSLSSSMIDYEDVFTEQDIGMVQSGEASGQLSKILDNLAKDTEKAYSIKSKIKSAMIYPAILFSLLIVVIVAMMIFVVPQLSELFASAGEDLPLITAIVMKISNFMVANKFLLLGIVVVIGFGFHLYRKTKSGRIQIDNLKINMPVLGVLFKKAYLSRFSRSLSNLIDSSISIIKALEIVANSIGNEIYRTKLLLASEDIKQGIPLAENLSSSDLFPPMLVNMVDVGEKTAQLDSVLSKVADFYEEEVDTAVSGLSKIIEPIILIVIGISVGIIVAAIILPIMQLSDIAGSL